MNYLIGLENEKIIKPIIECHFKLDLEHNDRYHLFDFQDKNEKNYIELKCRNCFSYTYKDLMMNLNKWNSGYKYMNFDKNVYYVFKFKDGIYYYQQNFTDNFEIKTYNEKQYIYIPTNKLMKINSKYYN